MSNETNNELPKEVTLEEELMKHTKQELVELLITEQEKVKKHKKEKSEIRKELKEVQEQLDESDEIHRNNAEYLKELNVQNNQLEKDKSLLQGRLHNVISAVEETLSTIESISSLSRGKLSFEITKKDIGE